MEKTIILGAGLAGLSCSYHIGHNFCVLLEKNDYPYGHINTEFIDGFTWDEGPHLSFTKYDYVKDLFAKSVEGRYLEYEVQTTNYYRGHWIPHPAQSNLFAVPENLREQCLEDFRKVRQQDSNSEPNNYMDWLVYAFGDTFAKTFPTAYTTKYWTIPPTKLDTDWVGKRMYYPSVDDVENGAIAPLPKQTHYIKKIRYPERGGYQSYAKLLQDGAQIQYNKELTGISFKNKTIRINNSEEISYEKLVVTLPLVELILMSDAPGEIKEAARTLRCTQLLLVNVAARHPTVRDENWIYVYDTDKYSTRINCTEKLSPYNAPPDTTGVQVEVYFSDSKPVQESQDDIAGKVVDELIEMGIIRSKKDILYVQTKWVPWANVVFDLERKEAQNKIFTWLEKHGLQREDDDLHPMTDWNAKLKDTNGVGNASIILAGRYAQWKYFWTDDCVLRGKFIGQNLVE